MDNDFQTSQASGEKSVLLLSGGPDSATLVNWAKDNDYQDIRALYLRAGHLTDSMELKCASKIARDKGATIEIIDVSQVVSGLGGQRILMHSGASIMAFGSAIVLSIAVSYATRVGARNVLIGLHADDAAQSSEYTQDFMDRFQNLVDQSSRGVKLLTPFLGLSKPEVFALGTSLGVDFANTWSCIREGELHCGKCGACQARARALAGTGQTDDTVYEHAVSMTGPIGPR